MKPGDATSRFRLPTVSDLFDLSDKTSLVVGGYGGLGSAIARALAGCGAQVAIAGRSLEKARAFADDLNEHAIGLAVDATDVASIRKSINEAVRKLGRIDIFVNCVGINIEEILLDATEEAFDAVYNLNLKSSMFLAQAVARHQVDTKRGGKHIHMLSVSAHRGVVGRGYSAYCATKGAQVMLVRQHALELALHGIQVNGLAPTYVATDMIRERLADPAQRKEMEATIPMGRIPFPEDIAGTAAFLASPASDFITGQVIYVDGGVSARR